MSDQPEDPVFGDASDAERAPSIPPELPVLPLRDTVLFPNSFMPLAVARESSVRLIDEAIGGGKLIAVFTQRDAAVDEPGQADLYPIGTATHIHKMFKLSDGSLRLIVQGLARLRLERVVSAKPYLRAEVVAAAEGTSDDGQARDRRAAAEHQGQLPAGRLALPAALRRPPDAGPQHHRPGEARRLHRLEPDDHHHAGQAGGARDARRPGPHGPAQPDPHQGARGPRARVEDPVAGAVGGRQEPARLLPARAAQGDPEGARRGRRPDEGDRGAAPRRSRRPGCRSR